MSSAWTDEVAEAAKRDWRRIPQAPRDAPPTSGAHVQLFRLGWADAIFRAPWWWPYVSLLPIMLRLLVWASLQASLAGAAWALLYVPLGALAWTLFEYLLHRFIFHMKGESEALKNALFLLHGHHHVWPRERSRLTATPWQAGLTLLLGWGLGQACSGAYALLFLCGFALAYVAYEAMHFYAHHGKPRGRLLRAFRAHHLRHHHETPTGKYGIGSPLWDWIFRT